MPNLIITLTTGKELDIHGPARIKYLGQHRGGAQFAINAHPSVPILRTKLNTPEQEAAMQAMLTGQPPLCLLPERK